MSGAANGGRSDTPDATAGRGALAAAALALLVRLAYLWAYRGSPLFDYYIADQRYYRTWGLRLAAGEWQGAGAFEQGPLYAYLLGIAYRLLGPRDLPVLALQLLAGVGTVLLTASCAGRLFGRRAAGLAGVLAALYGPLVFHEGLMMKSFLEPLLIMAALTAALRYGDGCRPRWLAAAGGAIGILCLVREIHILLLPPLLLWAWGRGGRSGLAAPRRAAHLGAAALAVACLVAPATLRNVTVGGEFAPVTTGGGEVLYMAYGPGASAYYTNPGFVRPLPRLEHEDFRDEARLRSGRYLTRSETSGYWSREAVREAAASPARTLRLAALKLRGLGNDYEYPDSENFAVARQLIPLLGWLPTFGWIVGLGIFGASLAPRENRDALLPLAWGAVCVLEILLTYGFGRFRLPLVPILLLFAGFAASRVPDVPRWWRAANRRQRLGLAAAALLAGLVTAGAFFPPPVSGGADRIAQFNGNYRSDIAVRARRRLVLERVRAHLAAAPGDAASWGVLGDELAALGKVPEAARAHLRALELGPVRAESVWSLANLSFQEGRIDLAAERARLYVRLIPGDARGHLALAVFCARLALEARDPERARELGGEAETHFDEAARLDPGDKSVFFYRGKFRALSGAWPAARGELAKALELDPGFAEARRVLTFVEARLRSGGR
jgi:4-amino-4-deoxy-L-arabinose transferase-like glycosyltransferase